MFSFGSILLAIVLFVIQIPLKAMLLALKASITTGKFAGKLTAKAVTDLTGTEDQVNELKDRVNSVGKKVKKVTDTTSKAVKKTANFTKNQIKKTPKRIKNTAKAVKNTAKFTKNTVKFTAKASKIAIKLSIQAIKLLIQLIKLLLMLIKVVIGLLVSLGIVGLIIAVVLLLIIIVSVVVPILLSDSETNSYQGSAISGGSESGKDDSPTEEVITDVDTSTLESSCESMANWYIANVNTYQQKTSGKGSGSRKAYNCSILNGGQTVYDDCTGFSAAYASLVSGKKVEAYGSEQLYKGGQSYIDAGWTRYTIKDIGGVSGLVVGDILVCSKDADSNCKGHHAEIYLGTGKSFGWGKIQTSFPSSSATLTDSSTEGYIEDGGSHIYGVIYRYTGGS